VPELTLLLQPILQDSYHGFGYSVKSKGIAKDIFGEEKLVLGIDEISDAGKINC
jgi:hypothetical protein